MSCSRTIRTHRAPSNSHPYLAVSGFIMASCIRRRVTSSGYDIDWATAPAKPPHINFAGMFSTRPPTQRLQNSHHDIMLPRRHNLPVFLSHLRHVYVGEYCMHRLLTFSKQKNEKPAYGTMPNSVGTKPRYSARQPPSLR